jgi:transcriptional regulator with XRE-family HTH domain
MRSAFGSRLRELRLRVDLTQEEVAEQAAISLTTYNRAENGNANLSFDLMCRLAPVLQVELTGLVDFEHHKARKRTRRPARYNK